MRIWNAVGHPNHIIMNAVIFLHYFSLQFCLQETKGWTSFMRRSTIIREIMCAFDWCDQTWEWFSFKHFYEPSCSGCCFNNCLHFLRHYFTACVSRSVRVSPGEESVRSLRLRNPFDSVFAGHCRVGVSDARPLLASDYSNGKNVILRKW